MMYTLAEDDPHYMLGRMPPLQAVAASPSQWEATLESASPHAIFSLLAQESSALVAEVIAAGNWSWQEDFLSLCSAERREEIQNATVEGGGALLAYVLKSLAGRL